MKKDVKPKTHKELFSRMSEAKTLGTSILAFIVLETIIARIQVFGLDAGLFIS
jgi:hypothetical protein